MPMKRIAAYCRVSTEKEEQLSSLENQRTFFEQYAEKSGDTLVKIYADEGISGKSLKRRDAFLNLLEDSKKDLFDCVVVKDISRFARNTQDFLYGIRTLKSNGVDVRFLSGNQTVIGESEFVLTVFAALAQEESANLSKRVIFGKKQNAKKGRVPNCVYGYNKLDTYTLEINPTESEIVKLIFKWYTENDGSRRITIKLNEMGIPTKRGAKWTAKTIRRMLQNPIYTGKLINNKTETRDFLSGTRMNIPEKEWYIHERPEWRIISDELFEKAGKKIKERRLQYENDNPGNRFSGRHIFSNLIKCSECGKTYTAKRYKWQNEYVRYRCSNHNNNGSVCCMNAATIDEQELLEEVKKFFIEVIEDKKAFTEKLLARYKAQNAETDAATLLSAKDKLLSKKRKLRELYVSGLMDIDELRLEFEEIDAGLSNIERELCEYNETIKKIEHIDDVTINIEKLLMQNEFTNADMRLLIDKIIVFPDKTVEIFMK